MRRMGCGGSTLAKSKVHPLRPQPAHSHSLLALDEHPEIPPKHHVGYFQRKNSNGHALAVDTRMPGDSPASIPDPEIGCTVRSETTISQRYNQQSFEASLSFPPSTESSGSGSISSRLDSFWGLAIEHAPICMLFTNDSGSIVLLNSVAERMFGYTKSELMGQCIDILIPTQMRAHHAHVRRDFTVKAAARTVPGVPSSPQTADMAKGRDVRAMCKDGSTFPVEIALNPVNMNGSFYVLCVVSDIRERKRNEEMLTRAKEAAEAASTSRSAFLAYMSHEIRTPLHGMLGSAVLLADTNLNANQRHTLADMQKCGNAMLVIVNDILDLSKIEAGKMNIERVRFEPREVISEAVAVVASQAASKHISFDSIVEDSVPTGIVGDPMRFRQILLNLFGNAVKFTEHGGVTARFACTGGDLVAEVSDTGIGIPADAQERIFAAFSQVYSSTTRKFGGTGLGLSITKRLVELMGGKLCVHSAPGVGSVFKVTLPVLTDASMPHVSSTMSITRASVSSLLDGHLLIAEDDAVCRRITQAFVKKMGCTSDAVMNGEEAVIAYQTGKYSAVLMDCEMPKMDGRSATRAIRALERTQAGDGHIPIIAMTANAMAGSHAEVIECGMDDFLSKPMSLDDLRMVLGRWLPHKEGMVSSETTTDSHS